MEDIDVRATPDMDGGHLVEWMVNEGEEVHKGMRLAIVARKNGTRTDLSSPSGGTLLSLGTVRGGALAAGGSTCVVQYCPHEVVFGGLCTVCGRDLSLSHFWEDPSSVPQFNVAYESDLKVSQAEAERTEEGRAKNLLEERRLSLVLDLDHTLLHATDDGRALAAMAGDDTPSTPGTPGTPGTPHATPRNHKGIHEIVLDAQRPLYAKLRPGLGTFLRRLAPKYELHIYTNGTRPYADAVAKTLDPDKKLFGARVTSRDDFEEGKFNHKNLQRVFPCDDGMVVIVDDREDVWLDESTHTVPNLLRARPYHFFLGLHEAYDRNSTTLVSQPQKERVAAGADAARPPRSAENAGRPPTSSAEAQDGAAKPNNAPRSDAPRAASNEAGTEPRPAQPASEQPASTEISSPPEAPSTGNAAVAADDSNVPDAAAAPATDNATTKTGDARDPKQRSMVAEPAEEPAPSSSKTPAGSEPDQRTWDEPKPDPQKSVGETRAGPPEVDESNKEAPRPSKLGSQTSKSDPKASGGDVIPDGTANQAPTSSKRPEGPRDRNQPGISRDPKQPPNLGLSLDAIGAPGSDQPSQDDVFSAETMKLVQKWWAADRKEGFHLKRLAELLEEIHERFFARADSNCSKPNPGGRWRPPADVKQVITKMRKQVLPGQHVAFTGIFPPNSNVREDAMWRLAESLGATAHSDVTAEVTHLVVHPQRGLRTKKAERARADQGIFCVLPSYLEASGENFRRASELEHSAFPPSPATRDLPLDDYREKVRAAHEKQLKWRHLVANGRIDEVDANATGEGGRTSAPSGGKGPLCTESAAAGAAADCKPRAGALAGENGSRAAQAGEKAPTSTLLGKRPRQADDEVDPAAKGIDEESVVRMES